MRACARYQRDFAGGQSHQVKAVLIVVRCAGEDSQRRDQRADRRKFRGLQNIGPRRMILWRLPAQMSDQFCKNTPIFEVSGREQAAVPIAAAGPSAPFPSAVRRPMESPHGSGRVPCPARRAPAGFEPPQRGRSLRSRRTIAGKTDSPHGKAAIGIGDGGRPRSRIDSGPATPCERWRSRPVGRVCLLPPAADMPPHRLWAAMGQECSERRQQRELHFPHNLRRDRLP
jgi:hypothetical protein